MTIRRRDLLAGAVAATLAPALAQASARRKFGGALDAGLLEKSPAGIAGGNPRTLDPHFARTRLERELASALHLPLFAKAPPHLAGRAAGLLVERAEPSRDAKTWTVTMRAGLVFSDDTPITAAAAAASLKRSLDAPAGRALAAILGEVRVRDDRRLEIDTRVPLRDLAGLLTGLSASVVSVRSADPFGGVAGAGGLRLDHAKPGEIVLVSNPSSPAGRAWLDRMRIVPGDTTEAAAAFRRGALQIAVANGRGPASERISGDAASTVFLRLSARLSPELRARAAAAPNVRVLTDVFLQGRARPASSLLPPALLGAPAGALAPREKPGKTATRARLSLFVADTSSEMQALADRLVFDLLEVGIAATVGWKTPDALDDIVTQDRYDLALGEWVPCDADAGRALAGAAKDPLLMQPDLAALASIEDRDARTIAAVAAAAKMAGAGFVVPLVHPRRVLRAAPIVDGLAIDAFGRVDWCDVGLR